MTNGSAGFLTFLSPFFTTGAKITAGEAPRLAATELARKSPDVLQHVMAAQGTRAAPFIWIGPQASRRKPLVQASLMSDDSSPAPVDLRLLTGRVCRSVESFDAAIADTFVIPGWYPPISPSDYRCHPSIKLLLGRYQHCHHRVCKMVWNM